MADIAEYNVDRLQAEIDEINEKIKNNGSTAKLEKIKEIKISESMKWAKKMGRKEMEDAKKFFTPEELHKIEQETNDFINTIMNLDIDKLNEDIKNGKIK